jgi:hypothetical protein
MKLISRISPPIFLVPAYGRTYATKEAALQAWNSGKDFQIYRGPYCSIRDEKELHNMSSGVFIQYDTGTVEV